MWQGAMMGGSGRGLLVAAVYYRVLSVGICRRVKAVLLDQEHTVRVEVWPPVAARAACGLYHLWVWLRVNRAAQAAIKQLRLRDIRRVRVRVRW
jgi:hypothetical protein